MYMYMYKYKYTLHIPQLFYAMKACDSECNIPCANGRGNIVYRKGLSHSV